MEARGLEPRTPGLQSRCSSQLSYAPYTFKKKQGRKGERYRGQEFRAIRHCLFGAVTSYSTFLIRKEVIQPHLPVRLPCYDFTPLARHTFGTVPLCRLD